MASFSGGGGGSVFSLVGSASSMNGSQIRCANAEAFRTRRPLAVLSERDIECCVSDEGFQNVAGCAQKPTVDCCVGKEEKLY